MRQAAQRRQRSPALVKSWPAPNGGLVANQNLAAPDARGPNGERINGASRLENWFPTATGCAVRGGSQKYATIGAGSAVTQLFSYAEGSNEKLFAANATDIYDITTIADSSVSPASSVASMTGGDWSVVQFTTSAGTFLRCVNGLDTPRVFDGTTWGVLPAITGATPTTLSRVWAFKSRLFFVQKDTLNAWYLPVDSIGGLAVKFPMGGIFNRGGSLMWGATWSIDAGFGPAEHCVFATTEGEIAIYAGTDPAGGLSTWSLVGVYRIGRPLGPDARIRAGGDVIIATDIGAVPLSAAIKTELAALARSAVSYPIEDEWTAAVAERAGTWHCEAWPTRQMIVVMPPHNNDARLFVANSVTGAWSIYTGWTGTCLKVFNERLFYGTTTGTIVEGEVTGADQGAAFTASCVAMFDFLKAPTSIKTAGMARAVYKAPAQVNERLSCQTDYEVRLPTAPSAAQPGAEGIWGSGVWGTSVWGTERETATFQRWRSVSGAGSALAPAVQITSGQTAPSEVELVRLDLSYEIGGPLT